MGPIIFIVLLDLRDRKWFWQGGGGAACRRTLKDGGFVFFGDDVFAGFDGATNNECACVQVFDLVLEGFKDVEETFIEGGDGLEFLFFVARDDVGGAVEEGVEAAMATRWSW